jgi:hypothetical protein
MAVEKTHAADKITGKTVFWKDIEIPLTSFENAAFWSKLFSLFRLSRNDFLTKLASCKIDS